jgi:hypothetical protein
LIWRDILLYGIPICMGITTSFHTISLQLYHIPSEGNYNIQPLSAMKWLIIWYTAR